MKIARFEPWHCSKCGHLMDSAASAFGDYLPDMDDVSLCFNCAEPYVLGLGHNGPTWRPMSDDELTALSVEEKQQMSKVQIAIREFQKTRKRGALPPS